MAVALVTGAQGFTGRYVCEELRRRGWRVHGLDRSGDPIDLLDQDAVAALIAALRPELVIHLAAVANVAHDDVEAIYRTNILGTRSLLSAIAAAALTSCRVVLASSANVYGNAGGVLDENVPPAPRNDYAVSKLAMEFLAGTFADRLQISITRPFNYTGVGQSTKFLLPKIVEHFRAGANCIELGNIDVWREFNDVRAVAVAYANLATHGLTGVYNICTGRQYSIREVLRIMTEISGHELEVKSNPALVRSNEVVELRGDPTRLIDRVGPMPEIGLQETLQWMFSA